MYRRCEESQTVGYSDLSSHGVPHTVLIVARGREAWRVSDFYFNFGASRGVRFKNL